MAEFCFKVAEGMYKLHDYETVMFGSDFVDEDDHRALQGMYHSLTSLPIYFNLYFSS